MKFWIKRVLLKAVKYTLTKTESWQMETKVLNRSLIMAKGYDSSEFSLICRKTNASAA